MLTTVCSNPCAKKVTIGNQQPMTLPGTVGAAIAITTPRQTSQLHSIALTKTVISPSVPMAA